MPEKNGKLLSSLQFTVDQLIREFSMIPNERRRLLSELTNFVSTKLSSSEKACLNFICTHNSRRSHMAQLWAQAAAHYYGFSKVECFSGGTDVTAFNASAIAALRQAGFEISQQDQEINPKYEVRFSNNAPPILAFSKKYDDPFNKAQEFAAVMTCSHADANCPIVTGARRRIALVYDDPKEFDGTPSESAKYLERVYEIGREMLFAFSRVNQATE